MNDCGIGLLLTWMYMLKKKLSFALLGCLSLSAMADVYVWTDATGQRHYSDQAQHNATRLSVDPGVSYYWVNKVFDGDTILLSDGRKIRFLGINTPEAVSYTHLTLPTKA